MTDIVGSRTLRSQWDETVRFYPENIFLEYVSTKDEVSSFTYAAFDRQVRQAANCFLELGIQKGELVALHLHNMPEYLVCWLALAQIGAVSVPLNEHYRLEESSYILKKCDIRRVIVEERSIDIYTGNAQALGLTDIIQVDGGGPGVLSLRAACARQPGTLRETRPLSSDDPAVILFTSGTTRHPKGAIYTHACVLYGGILHAHQIGMYAGDRFLSAMPCYHMDFQEMAAAPVICMGGTLVMIEHYSARRFWKQVVQFKANFIDMMSIMNRTVMMQPVQPWERDHCLKQVYFSMGLPDEDRAQFEERFGVRLLNCYGMTETVSSVTCSPLSGERRWPSVGRPAISYEVKIILDDGSIAPPGTPGEICIHGVPGRTLVLGYYHNDKATARLLDGEGWLHSGDEGYLDEDGWLYFLGRRGDMIKRSGENISALEVECILTSHEGVADAAVIGVPDPIRGQEVAAFVLPRRGAALDTEELAAFCRGRLAGFKVPCYIEIVSDFPRSASGKVKKQLLREAFSQKHPTAGEEKI